MMKKTVIAVAILLMTVSGSVSARVFDILKATNMEIDKKEVPKCLIAGGYVDGVLENETGQIYLVNQTDTLLVGEITIETVEKYEAIGRLEVAIDTVDLSTYFIRLEPVIAPDTLNLPIADQFYESKMYRRALYHYVKYLQLVDCQNEDVIKKVEDCRKKAKKEVKNQNKSLKPSKKYQDLGTILSTNSKFRLYFDLAMYYFSQGRYGPANEYLDKLLAMSKDYEPALRVKEVINELSGFEDKDFLLINADDTSEYIYDENCTALPHPDDSIKADIMPEMLVYATPDFSWEARNKKLSGTVWIKALIDTQGRVAKALVGKSSGHDELDQSALKASYSNRFLPAIKDHKPIDFWVAYKIEYSFD